MYTDISFKMLRINQLKRWHNAINLRKRGEMFFGQMPMLEYIGRHPGCSQKDIAERFAFTRAAISKSVVKLEEKNLVYRKTSQTDARENQLFLTELGKENIVMLKTSFDEINQLTFKDFTDEEIKQFDAFLDKILKNLETDYTFGKNPDKLFKELEKESE